MILRCLGSSSAGNCYLLDSGKEVLILDCGKRKVPTTYRHYQHDFSEW